MAVQLRERDARSRVSDLFDGPRDTRRDLAQQCAIIRYFDETFEQDIEEDGPPWSIIAEAQKIFRVRSRDGAKSSAALSRVNLLLNHS